MTQEQFSAQPVITSPLIITPVAQILDQGKIPYRLFTHNQPVHSLEEAAAERGQRPDQIVRSILFRLGTDRYAMVLMAGAAQVSWRKLRQFFGQSRLTMATAEEVQRVTGYPIGGVSPFGIDPTIPILIDEAILQESEISIGSGLRGTTIILRTEDMGNALPDAQIGNFKTEIGE